MEYVSIAHQDFMDLLRVAGELCGIVEDVIHGDLTNGKMLSTIGQLCVGHVAEFNMVRMDMVKELQLLV